MTNEIRIQVTQRCDRTGQARKNLMTFEAARAYRVDMRLKRMNAEKLRAFILSLDGPLPDLVVICDENIVLLENVEAIRSRGILRLLYELTRSKLFPKPERRARNENTQQTR